MNKMKVTSIALATAMIISNSAIAFADGGVITTTGGSTGYDSTTTTEDTGTVITPPAVTPIRHTIFYEFRGGDKGSMSFRQSLVNGRHTLGGENVPTISLPSDWELDGFYINGQKYTASSLAALEIPEGVEILNIEIRTYPDRDNNGFDDRNESYKVSFVVREGDKGELEFDSSTVVGNNNTLNSSDIPVLNDRTSWKYSITGYYVDGKKYSKRELTKLPIDRNMTVVVATHWNGKGNPSNLDELIQANGYVDEYGNWVGLRPLCPINQGCYIDGVWYNAPVLGANGWYYYGNQPCYQYNNYWYPITTATVTFVPQNGNAATSVNVYTGNRVSVPSTPYCKGYTFLGWSTSANGSTGYWNFNNLIGGNLTLYGIWTKNGNQPSYPTTVTPNGPSWTQETGLTCQVNLVPNNGMTFAPTRIPYGNGIKIEGQPTCPGYIFVGWAKDPEGRTFWNFARDKVMTDTTLYGVWRPAGSPAPVPRYNPATGASC